MTSETDFTLLCKLIKWGRIAIFSSQLYIGYLLIKAVIVSNPELKYLILALSISSFTTLILKNDLNKILAGETVHFAGYGKVGKSMPMIYNIVGLGYIWMPSLMMLLLAVNV